MAEPGAAVVCGCEALPSSAKNGLLDSCGFITAMQPDCFDANGLGRCCWCGSLLSALVSVGTVPTLRAQIHRFLLVRDIRNVHGRDMLYRNLLSLQLLKLLFHR